MARKIATIDAETDPFRKGRYPAPFLWGYYEKDHYVRFDKTSDFVEFLKARDVIAYAHNGGKFDFHFLLAELAPYDDLTIINGRIARCYLGKAELRDSWCIINEPLAKYKKDEIDYAIMEAGKRDKAGNRKKIEEYLRNDCIYLHEMVTGFIERFGCELTQATAAMKYWIKMSGQEGEKTNEEFYTEFHPFYYGGRVQCFQSGVINTDFSVYDINSAYPYAMSHKHPSGTKFERVTDYVANADFYVVRCISKGAFPYRGDGGGDSGVAAGLSFPCDDMERTFYVTGWEYAVAVETETIKAAKVLESITFLEHNDFSPYINKFWVERNEARKRGDVLETLFCKLMMNSLYGKFAANPENYKNYRIYPKDKAGTLSSNGQEWQFSGELGPWVLAERGLDSFQKRYYNLATGASITGFVRAMLWRAIFSSKGVLYCDTDSIAIWRAGPDIFVGAGLGAWKHEGEFDRAGIAGKKLYVFRGKKDAEGKRKNKSASKGVRLTEAELWRVAAGGTVDYSSMAPTYSAKQAPYFTKRRVVNTA
jgi:hypothetical protein